MIRIGLIGKPNAGKSTLFTALTDVPVDIANYPFTTVKPNLGMSFIKVSCPEKEIGKKCKPREGTCVDGVRHVPVEIIDVPGLIEGASEGKGMGNEFLDNLRNSDALIHIFDPLDSSELPGVRDLNPEELNNSMHATENEIMDWFSDRIFRDWEKFARKCDASGDRIESSLYTKLASFGLSEKDIASVLSDEFFPGKLSLWDKGDAKKFASVVFKKIKPIVRVANKADLLSEDQLQVMHDKYSDITLVSAEYELALTRAFSSKIIDRTETNFSISDSATPKQREALEKIRKFFANRGVSRAYDILEKISKDWLHHIVVFPVYDESSWTDKSGNVLPDAFLMPLGSTALDLAYKIHTQIGEGFIRAIDARTHRVVGRDHVLSDGDIIRIVSKS